nr:zinc finger protein 711-like [Penaeus vannamei]
MRQSPPVLLSSHLLHRTYRGRVASWQSGLVAHRPLLPTPSSQSVAVECITCGKTFYGFNRKFLLKRHMITHTGEKPFQCPHCPHRANLKQNLEVHIKRKHREQMPADYVPSSAAETP